jgi:hypothetical protein
MAQRSAPAYREETARTTSVGSHQSDLISNASFSARAIAGRYGIAIETAAMIAPLALGGARG